MVKPNPNYVKKEPPKKSVKKPENKKYKKPKKAKEDIIEKKDTPANRPLMNNEVLNTMMKKLENNKKK